MEVAERPHPDRMAPRPSLLAHAESPALRGLLEGLEIGGHEVSFVDSPARLTEGLQENPHAIALIDLGHCSLPQLQSIPTGVGKRVVLLSERFEREWVPAMLASVHFGSVIARSRMLREEVAVGVRKLLSRDLFGMEKYLQQPATIEKRVLYESARRAEVFDEILAFVEGFDADERIISQAVNLADELITNALYNAPVSAFGERLYKSESRLTPLMLPHERPVEISWACDGERVAIGVVDYYGSLERRTLIRYLAKSFARRDAPSTDVRVKAALFAGGQWRDVNLVHLSSTDVRLVHAGELPDAQVGTACRLEMFEGGDDEDLVADCRIVERREQGDQVELLGEFETVELSGGGGGTGLSTAYRASSGLVVNVVPGRKTECIGLVDIKGTYRQFVERGRSINLFYMRA